MLSRRLFLGMTAAVVVACSEEAAPPGGAIKVAAAADLAIAFKEVGEAYEKKTGTKVTFTFGSTGLLTKQIKEGAPFDVFAAANVKYIDDLVSAKGVIGDTKAIYARGRVVVFTTSDKVALESIADERFKKIAIANPEHAPYGVAAKEALTKVGLWSKVEGRLVFGENVQQTLQFAESGNADVAIVALSLAIHAKGAFTEIPADLHEPLDQAMAVCEISKEKDKAKDFVTFVNSADGRAIMTRHGFLLPGEALTASQ